MSAISSILQGKDPEVFSIRPDATVHDAVGVMCKNRIGALLVKTGRDLLGILTERDILIRVILARRDPATSTVAEVMTTEVVCILPDDDAETAMALMTRRRVRHLPVMDHGIVVGIVSIGDLVRWVSAEQDYEIRTLKEYVSGVYS